MDQDPLLLVLDAWIGGCCTVRVRQFEDRVRLTLYDARDLLSQFIVVGIEVSLREVARPVVRNSRRDSFSTIVNGTLCAAARPDPGLGVFVFIAGSPNLRKGSCRDY